ncbi:hypothetical protein VOLCADRAFT_105290 [Volvox carteri f. nagariensis]|uniref:Uncharacterized protein n=1 Tax=Volvox carteri f. nagariensis TaxID=3068 RepID=D8TZU0_VOLCA|nr:uncharacterized protein VOLCADRAFT_105290 [Volvox carteri f. nagariensis]EFJ46983.1 hypothetical protein VOLCADRAFT_105290 [Volvox carteri f. nagariensis]|eukprot:XP_002951878.1 hypothetical protein VOLCADRAFT_105290 [Volvox carteri f. nagariensis]
MQTNVVRCRTNELAWWAQTLRSTKHFFDNPESPRSPDICYPDKIGYAGIKVLTSTASTSGASNSRTRGRTHTRLVVGPDWIFAALFEAHGSSDLDVHRGCRETAARFCAEQCYGEFQRAKQDAVQAGHGASTSNVSNILAATLKALDRRFLSDTEISPQDRLMSGCTAVLLHVSLGENPTATAAALGPCAAVVGQRRGGLASATSAPLVLCGGAASSLDALQSFLSALGASQPCLPAGKAAASGVAASQKGRSKARASTSGASKDMSQQLTVLGPSGEPEYSRDLNAPQALGFGIGKGMRLAPTGRGAAAVAKPQEPQVGLEVQTSSHALGPADDGVVLLSSGAAAGITPTDVALLLHRMGRLAAIPYETKTRPLPLEESRGLVVQLDSLGVAGPPPAPAPYVTAAATQIAPFNAARLVVQHAVANAAARGANASGEPVGAMAFALEWPRSSDDSAAAAAASGASVSAVRAAAEAAAKARQRGQYRWQLLRLYYKFPHKRRVAIINKWHEVFDRVVGEGKRTANLKETAAWLRLGAAVKVSAAGNVQCLSSREDCDSGAIPVSSSEHQQQMQTPPRRTSPAPWQNRVTVGGGLPPNTSPLRGPVGQRSQSRQPLSAAGSAASPYGALTSGSARLRSPSLSPGHAGTPRCSSARDTLAAAAAVAAGAAAAAATAAEAAAHGPTVNPAVCGVRPSAGGGRGAMVASSPSRQGPVGLLEVEGINMQFASDQKPRRREPAKEGSTSGYVASPSPPLAGLPHTSPFQQSLAREFAAAAAAGVSGRSLLAEPSIIQVDPSGSSSASTTVLAAAAAAAAAAVAMPPPVGVAPASPAKSSTQLSSGSTTTAAAPSAAARRPAPLVIPTPTAANIAAPVSARSRIPNPSAGGARTSSPSGGGGSREGSPPSTSRSRTPRSRIPTLQLKVGPLGAAAAAAAAMHPTPRLSMPGYAPTYLPMAAGASHGGHSATPKTVASTSRTNNTWGGAAPTTPSGTSAGTPTAPNSARSIFTRLPRPAATPSASGATHFASPAGSVSSRSFIPGSDAGSFHRSGIARPPRLEVASPSVNGPPSAASAAAAVDVTATATTPGVEESDLFSPDADQLAAWAMEAIDAIGSSVKKKKPVPPPEEQRQEPSPGSSRSKLTSPWNALGGSSRSGGGARPHAGSRIPLSPR